MEQYLSAVKEIKNIIGIKREPVAVKMVKDDIELQNMDLHNYDNQTKCRYCQAVMRASKGEKVLLGAKNLACAAAVAAFGITNLHPKLASGAAHYNARTFGKQDAAHKIMSDMPRLPLGDYTFILLSPLSTCDFQPDVILIEAAPENLMWLALASIYTTGERLQFSTSVIQAACVDSTVVPLKTGKLNATLGCTGCREATDLEPTENLIGMPFPSFSLIIENLRSMEDVISKNRNKGVYKRFR
ncbi:MAG: DUF169 domain-containing protein [Syntrophomonadaceae bacterium]|jgi:uncharacterized protein (DUF169 family)